MTQRDKLVNSFFIGVGCGILYPFLYNAFPVSHFQAFLAVVGLSLILIAFANKGGK